MSRRVLITGASGYLGGRLADDLSREKHEVIAAFRSPASVPPELGGLAARFIDFSDPEGCRQADLSGVETIVHLAGTNERQTRESPSLSEKIDAQGTRTLLDSAIAAGVGKFIYVSTVHVYGVLEGTIDESTLPSPTTSYALNRMAAESAVLESHRTGKITGLVLRVSNVVGAPGFARAGCWTLLAHELARSAVKENRLVLRSAGEQWRDFLAMSDFLRAIRFFVASDPSNPAALFGDGLFNLGSGKSLTVRQAAQAIQRIASRMTAQAVELRAPPGVESEHSRFKYDTTKLRNAGFSPTGTFEDGIEELLGFCLSVFGKGSASRAGC